jgi:hypothetical protein
MKAPSIEKQQEAIEYELADLQCLEGCLERGFNIHDWFQFKSNSLAFMRERLIKHIEIERERKNKTI